ncbi:MAG: hypothetical protein HY924_00145 [Elusimicrobia bacterium]|nr:hypothetical protein [Elusimicrobiota bacterium]
MNKAWMLALAVVSGSVCLAAAQDAVAAGPTRGMLGAGVILGNPAGLTGKLWLDPTRAIDAGVGFSGDAAFYMDFLWHAWDLFPQPKTGKLGAYASVGPRLETRRDAEFGVRTLAGLVYWLPKHPIELFVEAGPVWRVAPDSGVEADGGLGVRFYFGGRK